MDSIVPGEGPTRCQRAQGEGAVGNHWGNTWDIHQFLENMYICIIYYYIYMHVLLYHVYVYVCVCAYVHVYVHVYIICTCICICTYIDMCTYMEVAPKVHTGNGDYKGRQCWNRGPDKRILLSLGILTLYFPW